jgi:hypothetical protein
MRGLPIRVYRKAMDLMFKLALVSTPCEKMASFLIFAPALLRGRAKKAEQDEIYLQPASSSIHGETRESWRGALKSLAKWQPSIRRASLWN